MPRSDTTVKSTGIYIGISSGFINKLSRTQPGITVAKLIDGKLCYYKTVLSNRLDSLLNFIEIRKCLEYEYVHPKFTKHFAYIYIFCNYPVSFKHTLCRNRPYICRNKGICPTGCSSCYIDSRSYIVLNYFKILRKANCIACKCIGSYYVCSSLNILSVYSFNPVAGICVGCLRYRISIIYFSIISSKCSICNNP